VVWGQEYYKSLKKWSDLMPINVTVTNTGKILLQETIVKILVLTLAASRLNSKVYLFSFGVSRIVSDAPWSHKNSKLKCYNIKSRLSCPNP